MRRLSVEVAHIVGDDLWHPGHEGDIILTKAVMRIEVLKVLTSYRGY